MRKQPFAFAPSTQRLCPKGLSFSGKFVSALAIAFIITITVKGQILYGTTESGNIFKYDIPGNIVSLIYLEGQATGDLVAGPDKKLYARNGSYVFDPCTSSFSPLGIPGILTLAAPGNRIYSISNAALYSFDVLLNEVSTVDNTHDFGTYNLIRAADEKLYGISSNKHLYSFDPLSNNYEVVDSANNFGEFIIQAGDGKLYGIVHETPEYPSGFVFSYDLLTHIYTVFVANAENVGSNPIKNIVAAGDGKLYGRMAKEGFDNQGAIFSFQPSTGEFKNYYNIHLSERIYAGLTTASNGKIYTVFYEDVYGSSFIWPGGGLILNDDAAEYSSATLVEIPGGCIIKNEYYSAANGNWDEPATWEKNEVPPANADVIIRHQINATVNTSCNTLKVINPGSLNVKPGIHITVLH